MIMKNQATLDFIREHADDDVRQLALRGSKMSEVDLSYALEQIAGRQKAHTKLPSWASIDGIVYPPHLSMEQCSSELTARYKASIAGKGALFVDLTAGFVDYRLLKVFVITFRYKYRHFLHTMNHADLLFIDPARRDEHGGRTYGIADCTPNVLEMLDEMLEKADRVMIKLSPMLDWRKAVADLGKVNDVHIISVDNECKELLLAVNSEERGKNSASPSLRVVCVNLLSDGNKECFEFDGYHASPSSSAFHFSPFDSRFLYEPNASIMKAGCFGLLEQRFGVMQLDKNSHLFVSDKEVIGFPGREFLIEKRTSMNKRELKAALADIDKANITVRNFPMSVAELRKRLKLKEGGEVYIFATTIANEGHQLLVCRKKT